MATRRRVSPSCCQQTAWQSQGFYSLSACNFRQVCMTNCTSDQFLFRESLEISEQIALMQLYGDLRGCRSFHTMKFASVVTTFSGLRRRPSSHGVFCCCCDFVPRRGRIIFKVHRPNFTLPTRDVQGLNWTSRTPVHVVAGQCSPTKHVH